MKPGEISSWMRLGALAQSADPARRPGWFRIDLPRGFALFLGGFALLNLLTGSHSDGFDGNLWWIDLRRLPSVVARGIILISAVSLLGFACYPPRSRWRCWATWGSVALLVVAALVNSAQFYILLARGTIRTGIPIPMSLFVAAGLLTVLAAVRQPPLNTRHSAGSTDAWTRSRGAALQKPWRIAAVCLVCAILFPLLQMFCFGKTDYRRPADVAVVLGARVYADGRPSDALADRVRTACRLYREGLVHKLIFSGGPGDGAVTEPESMRRMAVGLGVKADDIALDTAGLNTQATVNNSLALLPRSHAARVLVVSHFYHLPRIKLSYQRAGWEVYTVPAKESYLLRQMPYNMAREVAALWVYYLRTITGCSAHPLTA